MSVHRCAWVPLGDPLYCAYHDQEWGVPLRDERRLFEFLVLESAQAGLSWATILHRREGYRRAYAGFDPERLARFGDDDVNRLMVDSGIIRNRRKIASAIHNAQIYLGLRERGETLAEHLWSVVGQTPRINRWREISEVPATTVESDQLSRSLKKLGFSFVGSTICYALMQAAGLVNDHTIACYRWQELGGAQ